MSASGEKETQLHVPLQQPVELTPHRASTASALNIPEPSPQQQRTSVAGSSAAATRQHVAAQQALQQENVDAQQRKRQAALVASTFSNVELDTTRKTLKQYVTMYEDALEENRKLEQEIKQRDLDSLQVVEFLRQELGKKSADLDETNTKLYDREEGEKKTVAELEKRYVEVVASKDASIVELSTEVSRLQNELEGLALFKRERQEILLEINSAKDKHDAMVQKYEKEITRLRFQALEEKVKLRATEEEMSQKFNQEVDARAMILVDEKGKKIHQQNKQLVEEKSTLQGEVSDLVALTVDLQSEMRELRRNSSVTEDVQKETVKHASKLSRYARDADTRIRGLENKLSHLVSEYENRLSQTTTDANSEVEMWKERAARAETTSAHLRKELVKVRQLGKTIVSQRSELESFFHDTLEMVKSEITTSSATTMTRQQGTSSQAAETMEVFHGQKNQVPPLALPGSARGIRPQSSPRDQRLINSARERQSSQQASMGFPAVKTTSIGSANMHKKRTIASGGLQRTDPPPLFRDQLNAPNAARSTFAERHKNETVLKNAPLLQQQHSEHPVFSKAPLSAVNQEERIQEERATVDSRALTVTPSQEEEEEGGRVGDENEPDFSIHPVRPGSTSNRENATTTPIGGGGAFGTVDIGDLSWSDREMVIRSLLFHINQRYFASDTTYSQAPSQMQVQAAVRASAKKRSDVELQSHQQLPSLREESGNLKGSRPSTCSTIHSQTTSRPTTAGNATAPVVGNKRVSSAGGGGAGPSKPPMPRPPLRSCSGAKSNAGSAVSSSTDAAMNLLSTTDGGAGNRLPSRPGLLSRGSSGRSISSPRGGASDGTSADAPGNNNFFVTEGKGIGLPSAGALQSAITTDP